VLKLAADIKGVYALIKALRDGASGVRRKAAEVLVELKDPRSIELLIITLKDLKWYQSLIPTLLIVCSQDWKKPT